MALNQPNVNGQNTSANSAPVVIASDQSALPISGKFNASQPTLTDGNLTNVQFDSRGNLKVAISQANTSGNNMVIANPGDGEVVGSASVNVKSRTMLYNGTTFDLARSSGPIGTAAVAGSFIELTGSAAAVNADILASTDVSAYKWFSVHITAIATGGTIAFQQSNDNSLFVSTLVTRPSVPTALPFSSTTATDVYVGPITSRFLRFRQTAWTSGTTTATIELYTVPPPSYITSSVSTQAGTWTMQPGNTANTTPWLQTISPTTGVAGLTPYNNQALTNTAVQIKSGATRLYQYDFYNPNTTGVWIQLFNATAVTLGTTVPVRNIYVPPSAGRDDEAVYSVAFGTGLMIAATTTAGGAAAPATPVSAFLGYV